MSNDVSLAGQLLLTLTSLSTSTILLLVAIVTAVVYYNYMNYCGDDWTKHGVKEARLPKFFFFGANFRSLFAQLIKQYGDTVGIKTGPRMMLLTTNFDLLRHVLIKDFNNFVDRGDSFLTSTPLGKSLFFAKGLNWRRQRHIFSPTFTSGKLKYISKAVEKSAQDLATFLEKFAKEGRTVEIKDICGRYTCELVAKTAFGLDAQCINEDEIEFYSYAKNMLRLDIRKGLWRYIFVILMAIPNLPKFAVNVMKNQYFDNVCHKANKYFEVILMNTFAERKQKQQKGLKKTHVDFLDLLLKANDSTASGKVESAEEEFPSQGWNPDEKMVMPLTDEEMIGVSMLIIFAGMETTATTLQMCLYELAANPDVQEKVFQEIESVIKNSSPTTEELNSLSYTEQVINETLRKYPPVGIVSRAAKETRTYNGITIPKNANVMIPYFYILSDPNIFPEPHKFDPDRFSPAEKEKRDPLSFIAFGQGPRLCLGMRLAYLELKQALAHVLRKLRVVLNEQTEPKAGSEGVQFNPRGLLTPTKPIMLAFQLRNA